MYLDYWDREVSDRGLPQIFIIGLAQIFIRISPNSNKDYNSRRRTVNQTIIKFPRVPSFESVQPPTRISHSIQQQS